MFWQFRQDRTRRGVTVMSTSNEREAFAYLAFVLHWGFFILCMLNPVLFVAFVPYGVVATYVTHRWAPMFDAVRHEDDTTILFAGVLAFFSGLSFVLFTVTSRRDA